MIEYAYLLLGILILAVILILIALLSRSKSDLMIERIIEKASGVSKISKIHLEVASKLTKIGEGKKSSDIVSTEIDLDKLVMTLLGFGGIFKFILTKKRFAPRELIVELNLTMDTVRRWINSALEMNIIEKTKTVHGAYLYQLNKRVIVEHLDSLRSKIIEFTGMETCLLYTSPSPRDRG